MATHSCFVYSLRYYNSPMCRILFFWLMFRLNRPTRHSSRCYRSSLHRYRLKLKPKIKVTSTNIMSKLAAYRQEHKNLLLNFQFLAFGSKINTNYTKLNCQIEASITQKASLEPAQAFQ